MKHTFDWHEEGETFLKWAMVNMLTGRSRGDRLMRQVSEASDKFRNVELGITLNGIEVDAKWFMESIDKAMDVAVDRAAAREVQRLADLNDLHDMVSGLARDMRDKIREAAREHNITLNEEDW